VTVRGIHHVGIAVADLDEALATYERLFGATLERRSTVPDQGVHALSVLVGEDRIELVSPTGADTPVGRFLAEAGAQLIDEAPRPGLFGLEVAFVHPDAVHGVLTEVVSPA
jgi:methylmalonyl-CoA/ethylmalonyl-CoA epimerase